MKKPPDSWTAQSHEKEASTNNVNSLSHSKWECKYHVVWIPKCRRKVLFGQLRKHIGEVLHDLARQKQSKILEGHLQQDHVHVLISIPPKYSVAQVVGYIKGKSAIHIARNYLGQKKNYGGMNFWARGYFVSTVGTDEDVVRTYIREQEKEDKRVEQLSLFK
ncbi:MAG: transposase [Desulfovibrio sp. S3730MH75]|nr:MAG: transposase [Desulfovibrio sp. S3730MH75]